MSTSPEFFPHDFCLVRYAYDIIPAFTCVGEIISRRTIDNTYMVRQLPDDPSTMVELPESQILKLTMPKSEIKYCLYAEVSGRFNFPIDMLRYDRAVPVNFHIDGMCKGKNDICRGPEIDRLIIGRVCPSKKHGFTLGRWASFGWTCKPLNYVKIEKGQR